MKTTTVIIVLFFFALSCNNSQQDKSNTENSKNISAELNHDSDSRLENSLVYDPADALWEYQFDTIKKDFKPVKLRQFNPDTLSIKSIVTIINKTWPKVQIKYVKTSKDTVFISIPNSEVLTQQMGTTGAEQFMISTTYSFTELANIKYVLYDFEPGDHANPGVYNRSSWN